MPEPRRPVLLAVDDDDHVLRAIRRDLSRAYRDRFRVLAAGSAAEGLRVLDTLREREEQAALVLSDQRMPGMTGIAFLAEAARRFPEARRVLLTAYADTSVAISAINEVRLDHYLVKPWEPPEERLYPVLDDLLSDWEGAHEPPYQGIRLVGHPFAPATHRLRDLLTRYRLPFRFEEGPAGEARLPAVVLPDGRRLDRPGHGEVVAALGLATRLSHPHYDLAIVGGGPAGLAASVYASSEGMATLLIEAYVPGGQAGTSSRIENYLGFPSGISGVDLTSRAMAQARRFGVDVLAPVEARRLSRDGRACVLHLSDGKEIGASTVLLSTGLSYRSLDADGAARFEGAGIYYGAAVTETESCAGRHVWIVGGANSAGQAALHFARHASRVTMVVRAAGLAGAMSAYLVDEIAAAPNITVRAGTRVVAAEGGEHLERITLCDVATGELSGHDAEHVFVFIGARPRTEWLDGLVRRDPHGFLLTGPDLGPAAELPAWDLPRPPLLLETSMPGVFAAGDARAGSVKRLASGVGEGAMAVSMIHRYRSES
ncbi:FAD-dependent oxidoreductase [Actinomadura sp. ATCC 31491]|uniref:FAD-dependent oxidoreductase n=1 Tax=Actinomadura luzonensis TaxID=2805427 RepID=A0ABT0G974_9ACTN|nr:FAD-dependent oxidoreductase [Actinomadura luzonensis]MCK2220666.1 FAD-dependent oxidoreductase [Actinomadura luzonensis]